MENGKSRPGNQGRQTVREQSIGESRVPFIPGWVTEWGIVIPLAAAIPLLALITEVVKYDGDGSAWALVLSGAVVTVALFVYDYIRRRKGRRRTQQQALRAALALASVDEMSPDGFEAHCGRLLVSRDFTGVQKTSMRSEDKKVDFTAVSPEKKPVAVEVKHRKKGSVGRPMISKLAGDIAAGMYKGRAGIIMTNAPVTRDAKKHARDLGITIVDRDLLGVWLAEALGEEQQAELPLVGRGLSGWVRSWSAEAKAAAIVVTGSCLVMLIVTVQTVVQARSAAAGAAPGPEASATARPSPVAAVTSPSSVVLAYLAAISRHDWPEVWKLGGENVGRGASASYAGMVAGYRGTVKDVPVKLQVKGSAVSGRFLAYESGGATRTYTFTYMTHGGAIVRAAVREVSSAQPK